MIAKILLATFAVRAGAIDPADPGDADAGTERDLVRCHVNDVSDDLVAGNHLRMLWRKFALDNVEIGATDTTGTDAEKHVAGFKDGLGDLGDLQRMLGNWARRGEDGSFHDSRYDAEIINELGGDRGEGVILGLGRGARRTISLDDGV
jgi:hypothetical protein